jgi:hypothetical protein
MNPPLTTAVDPALRGEILDVNYADGIALILQPDGTEAYVPLERLAEVEPPEAPTVYCRMCGDPTAGGPFCDAGCHADYTTICEEECR